MILTALVAFRRGAGAAFTSYLCSARITPMRANIAGPSCSATAVTTAWRPAILRHRVLPRGQFRDVVCGVAKRDQRFPSRQYDRIEKPLIPRHNFDPAITFAVAFDQLGLTIPEPFAGMHHPHRDAHRNLHNCPISAQFGVA